jgi:hypothetical protein
MINSPCTWLRKLCSGWQNLFHSLAVSNVDACLDQRSKQNLQAQIQSTRSSCPDHFCERQVQLFESGEHLWSSTLNSYTFSKRVVEALGMEWPDEIGDMDEDPTLSFMGALLLPRY